MTPSACRSIQGGGGMRGFRFILAVGFTTALPCTERAVSTDLQPADSATIDSQQDNRSSQKLDAATPDVMQGVLGNAKSDRQKPRRARPAPRTSSRPKTVSQRTRQVGKKARTRSTQRLNTNKARAKQRIKRTSVPARRKGNITRKRPPLVQAHRTTRAPARKTSTKRSHATPERKKPKAKNK